jgi:hypothetical protein
LRLRLQLGSTNECARIPRRSLLSEVRNLEKRSRGAAVVSPTIDEAVEAKDPYEWPSLLAGGWLSSWVLYAIAPVAYYKHILVGRTYLLVASVMCLVWIALGALVVFAQRFVARRVRDMREQA